MTKGYWIALIDVTDPGAFAEYGALSTDIVNQYGGRFVVRGGKSQQFEGTGRARQAVVEFDSFDAAVACYQSDAYQSAADIRHGGAIADVVIVEGA
ncbi:DUF1330 domain-containing protein [soil metagenome]